MAGNHVGSNYTLSLVQDTVRFFILSRKQPTHMSCLFRSIASLLRVDHVQLRQRICDYLAEDPVLMEDGTRASHILKWESDIPSDKYITRMRSEISWGGAPEIVAVCNLSGRAVYVHDIRTTPVKVIEFLPLRPSSRRALHVSWNGGHYEPLYKGMCENNKNKDSQLVTP